MKFKFKKKKKFKFKTNSTTPTRYDEFIIALRTTKPFHHFGLVREWYEDLFNEFPPIDRHPLEMIKLRIAFELLHRKYVDTKETMPDAAKQNWKATKDFNVNKLTDSLKKLTKIKIEKSNERS